MYLLATQVIGRLNFGIVSLRIYHFDSFRMLFCIIDARGEKQRNLKIYIVNSQTYFYIYIYRYIQVRLKRGKEKIKCCRK